MSARAIAFACLSAALLAGCGPVSKPPVDTAKVVDAIKTDEVHWNADYKSGDAAKVAAHFARDAVAMNSGSPPLVGSAAIQSADSRFIAQPGFSFSFVSSRVDVAASGDLAAARGGYTLTTTDPKTGAPTTVVGNYVTVCKPGADGVWRAVWDISTPGVAKP
jgi:ketosteroid isomerase-like protein